MIDPSKVRRFRIKKKLTMAQAAKRAGLSRRQDWYKVESKAIPRMSIGKALAIAKALGCKVDQLLRT